MRYDLSILTGKSMVDVFGPLLRLEEGGTTEFVVAQLPAVVLQLSM